MLTHKTRRGHPEREGSQLVVRAMMFKVFEYIDAHGHAFLWDELVDCLDDEAKARGYNGFKDITIVSTGTPEMEFVD